MTTITVREKFLSFEGIAEDALGLIATMREACAGQELPKVMSDFLFSIEAELQRHGFLGENFEPLVKISEDEFEERFQPQPNHLVLDAGFNGWLYDTHGAEADFISEFAVKCPERVWAVLETDEGMSIVSGVHFVNRMGYIITKEPVPDGRRIEVELDCEVDAS